jgi:hypothetical protein
VQPHLGPINWRAAAFNLIMVFDDVIELALNAITCMPLTIGLAWCFNVNDRLIFV